MEQTWNDLLFAHWRVSSEILRALVPPTLELDTFQGEAWVAVTPFHMTGIRGRWLPPVPGLSRFPELNVRTYVKYGGKRGVYFFSLDAASRAAVWAARATYYLPYFHARMDVRTIDGLVKYHSVRNSAAEFRGNYQPTAAPQLRPPGTLEHWLSERYCLYAVAKSSVFRAEIHHAQWPLQNAEAEIPVNTMASAAGIRLADVPPLLHFAKNLRVLIWPLRKVS